MIRKSIVTNSEKTWRKNRIVIPIVNLNAKIEHTYTDQFGSLVSVLDEQLAKKMQENENIGYGTVPKRKFQ